MKLHYTRYGSIDMLWSLIPIFPAWTIFPGFFISMLIGQQTEDCERGFEVTNWLTIVSCVVLVGCFIVYTSTQQMTGDNRSLRRTYRLFNLALYTFVNTSSFFFLIGYHMCCEGDGQTVLGVFYSAPLASASLPLMGVVLDIVNRKHASKAD